MDKDLEKRIRAIGHEICASIDETPAVFDRKRWIGRIMEPAMTDEGFRLALIRFVDVLPCLRTDAAAVKLFREYFTDEINSPRFIKWGLERISKTRFPRLTGRIIRAGGRGLVQQFIAGRDPEHSLKTLNTIWDKGLSTSIDILGEAVLSDFEAGEYTRRYLNLLNVLSSINKVSLQNNPEALRKHSVPNSDITLKISSFYSRLDPMDWEGSISGVKEGLKPVLNRAGELGIPVTFDMEHYDHKNITIEIFKSIAEEYRNIPLPGIALQCYLKNAKEDLLQLIHWSKEARRRVLVRLVKGAYWDYEMVVNRQKGWPVPVFTSKEETDNSFEELTRILIENSSIIRPAIAGHNIRSISNAIALSEDLGIAKDKFEFQILFGMGEPLARALRRMGYAVRVYTPLGDAVPGMAYLVRRLLENTANESFLRKFFGEKVPFEEIIRKPLIDREYISEDREEVFRNEPSADFSVAEKRMNMEEALKKIRGIFGAEYPLYINGEEVVTEEKIISVNPAKPEEVVGRVSSAARNDVQSAVEGARTAFGLWKKIAPKERAGILLSAADEIKRDRLDLAALEVYETGKSWRDADGDVTEAIDYLRYYSGEMIKISNQKQVPDYPGEENDFFYEPRGVGAVISPWNFPLAIPCGMVSAALVTGNCVVFKPSGLSPVTGWNLVQAFTRAGLPPGVLQFLPGPGGAIGEFLVSHPDIDFVAFTGSKEVGLQIIKRAGEVVPGQRNIKKVIAEMGGKNAIIVDETADPDEAVKGVLESAFGYQGQKCSACSRVIVSKEIFDEFCGRLKAATGSLTVGSPERPGMIIGPVIDKNALRKILRFRVIGEKSGKVIYSTDCSGDGYFTGPVILTNTPMDSPIAQEEIFGPVLIVIRADDIEEAILIANNTPYALTGGIFSRSPENIRKAKAGFRVGNLYINRKITGALVGRQPFGGFGMSGAGSKAGGPDYLLNFMTPRSISENTLRRGFAPSIRPI